MKARRGIAKERPELEDLVTTRNEALWRKIFFNWLITDPCLLIDEHKEDAKHLKNYQVQNQEGLKYVFFCGGRFKTIKQKPINVLTGVLLVAPAVLFWIFDAKWLCDHISPSLVVIFTYIWFLSFSYFVNASTSDPGTLPRNVHLPYKIDDESTKAPEEYFSTVSLPYKDEHTPVTVRYCSTCHIWRPPRTSHCSVCNSCIAALDHHCIFLNNCVGQRNHSVFLWFLLSTVTCCILLAILSFVQIFHYLMVSNSEIKTFRESITKHPVAFLLAIYSLLGLVYPWMLLLCHLFLTSFNVTTREYLSNYQTRGTVYLLFTSFNPNSTIKSLYLNWLGKPNGVSLIPMRDSYTRGDMRFEKVKPLQSFTV